MVRIPRRFLLDERDAGRVVRFVASEISLSEGVTRSWVTLTRTGSFTDPRYGRFEITPKMLADMVRNFTAGTYGQEIFIDVAHEPDKGAAAKVLSLKADGNRLRAEVEWTPYGLAAVRERGFRYLSADFFDDFTDNEAGKSHGPLLRGAGLTIRPVIKRLDPVQLAESAHPSGPVLLSPGIVRQLTEQLETEIMNRWEKLLAKLKAAGKKLSEKQLAALKSAFEAASKTLAETDEGASLHDQFLTLAESIETAGEGAAITLSVTAPAAPAADDAAIKAAVAKELAARDAASKKLSESLDAKRKAYDAAIAAATGLSEDTRKQLSESRDLIGSEFTDEQVKRLAENQIALGNQLEASRKLSAIGFARPQGTPHITVDESNGIKKLAESVRTGLRNSGAFVAGQLRGVTDESKVSPFAQKMLAEFDREHASRLHAEAKMLAGGPVNIADTALPASYQREVLLEALADLRILDLVGANVDITQSATHTIPYEERQTGSVYSDGTTYEGQAIQLAGVKQLNGTAYIEPMKIALEQTDEVMDFSRNNGLINYDAWGRNIASNARLAREILARKISNRMQRISDAFGATAVVAEALDAQITGSNSLIKLAQFPLVRPYQPKDLQGTNTGTAENTITFTLNGVAITPWDGTGTQAAGTYYNVENWNLGLIRLVDTTGTPVTPADSGVNTISYHYATNVAKFDTDNGSVELPKHLNGLLRKIGAQKALMANDRFVVPNFGLSSHLLNDTASNAEQFVVSLTRDGSNTNTQGDLLAVKAIPMWATNTPSDIGDERVLMGLRGAFRYTVAKPFSIGERYPILNSSGRPLGKWGAYGTEFHSLYVPPPHRGYFTSVIAYSAAARTAAA